MATDYETNAGEIEKDIPLPPVAFGVPCRYKFDEMEVGDSFMNEVLVVHPEGGEYDEEEFAKRSADALRRAQQALLSSAKDFAKREGNPNMKFATRQVEGGVRIWRTA